MRFSTIKASYALSAIRSFCEALGSLATSESDGRRSAVILDPLWARTRVPNASPPRGSSELHSNWKLCTCVIRQPQCKPDTGRPPAVCVGGHISNFPQPGLHALRDGVRSFAATENVVRHPPGCVLIETVQHVRL